MKNIEIAYPQQNVCATCDQLRLIFQKIYLANPCKSAPGQEKSDICVSFKQMVQTEEVAVVKLPQNGESRSKIRC